jgi:hypothetical protein
MCTKLNICLKTQNSKRLEVKTFVMIFFHVPRIKAFENYIGKSLDGPSLELVMYYWL